MGVSQYRAYLIDKKTEDRIMQILLDKDAETLRNFLEEISENTEDIILGESTDWPWLFGNFRYLEKRNICSICGSKEGNDVSNLHDFIVFFALGKDIPDFLKKLTNAGFQKDEEYLSIVSDWLRYVGYDAWADDLDIYGEEVYESMRGLIATLDDATTKNAAFLVEVAY